MVASQVHLVRHGEVFNPDGILYGRLSGFGLSKLGHRMAQATADDLLARGRSVTAIRMSPLQRTRESAAPIVAAFGVEPTVDERIIEPTNRFEGTVMRRALKKPVNWPFLVNPLRPSWGEPYRSIEKRMLAAIQDAFDSVESGDVVLVSHQLPIWVTHLSVAGERFPHDPRKRRCALSSITTFERVEVQEPSAAPSEAATPTALVAATSVATAPVPAPPVRETLTAGTSAPEPPVAEPAAARDAAHLPTGSAVPGPPTASAATPSPATGSAAAHHPATTPLPRFSLAEVGYVEPAAGLSASATDVGAV